MNFLRYCCLILLFIPLLLSGCGNSKSITTQNSTMKIGIMLVEYGLGDQSFNDTTFLGLIKAREELGITFDYRDLKSSKTYEQGFTELIEDENCDLIIALGIDMVNDLTKVAKAHPKQQFLIFDQVVDLPNITSVTFRENEGSFLVGAIAGMKTISNTIGFIGGMDIPVIHRFRDGFISGVKAVNPNAEVLVEYAGAFNNPEIGRKIASGMITNKNADIIYSAAGFSGMGAIEEAANQKVYAIGVDNDQFYVAEQTVITSALKKIDVAVFTLVKQLVEKRELSNGPIELGLLDNAVGYAPVRVVSLTDDETKKLEDLEKKLLNGEIKLD